MCFIAIGKAGKIRNLPLKQLWANNPDGAGLWGYQRGKNAGQVIKGLMQLSELISALKMLDHRRSAVLHLRLATQGPKEPAQCHPFPVAAHSPFDGHVEAHDQLFHNGCLLHLGSAIESDTEHLARLLSAIAPVERLALLGALPGRYVLVRPNGAIQTQGVWSQWHGLTVSAIPYTWPRSRCDKGKTWQGASGLGFHAQHLAPSAVSGSKNKRVYSTASPQWDQSYYLHPDERE